MDNEDTRLAIWTVVTRVPKDNPLSGLWGLDTKYGYLGEIVDYTILAEDDNGDFRPPW